MALAPTPENFRAEMARHCLTRRDICDVIGMNPNLFSGFVNGTRPLMGWAAHNIGYGINLVTGLRLLDVDQGVGVLPAPPRGRPQRWNRPDAVDPLRRPAGRWRRARKQAS